MSEPNPLAVRLVAAVVANVTSNPDGTLNLNATVAMEMVEDLLMKHEIIKIKRRKTR